MCESNVLEEWRMNALEAYNSGITLSEMLKEVDEAGNRGNYHGWNFQVLYEDIRKKLMSDLKNLGYRAEIHTYRMFTSIKIYPKEDNKYEN